MPDGSRIRKHSAVVDGHRTSFSIEDDFFAELQRLAEGSGISLSRLLTRIDSGRTGNLSSAARLFVLASLKAESAGMSKKRRAA